MQKRKFFLELDEFILIIFFFFLVLGMIFRGEIQTGVNDLIHFGGLSLMFIICFILEPTIFIIGPFAVLLAAVLLGFNEFYTISVLVISTTSSSILAYFFGYRYNKLALKFISQKKILSYKTFFKKYGNYAMILNALLPMPYLPLLAGAFKIPPRYFLFLVTPIRILKYIAVALILFWIF